jgi:cytochrome c-type biogenesis protein CcmH/NrfG
MAKFKMKAHLEVFGIQKKIQFLTQLWQEIPKSFLLSLTIFLVSIFLVNQENQKMSQKILGQQTQIRADQQTITAWEQILEERPDYRDGWIQLAAAYYKIGERLKAKQALEKAKALDPNNETILNFEKFLEE